MIEYDGDLEIARIAIPTQHGHLVAVVQRESKEQTVTIGDLNKIADEITSFLKSADATIVMYGDRR